MGRSKASTFGKGSTKHSTELLFQGFCRYAECRQYFDVFVIQIMKLVLFCICQPISPYRQSLNSFKKSFQTLSIMNVSVETLAVFGQAAEVSHNLRKSLPGSVFWLLHGKECSPCVNIMSLFDQGVKSIKASQNLQLWDLLTHHL